MKTGKHYFSLLTEEEQRNFKQACEEQTNDLDDKMELIYINFCSFIGSAFYWINTRQGEHYWRNIAESKRDEKHNGLVTFKRIFIYSIITFVALSLLLIAYKVGYDNGHNTGYQHGIEKVDSIVNYEELTPESVEAVQSMQLNTTRINENRPKR